jgi:acetoacetyl-CoA reductase/3-oxoacyl-[acyl-carrier protein] reductase
MTTRQFDFNGRVAIVTGGAQGIGAAIADGLVEGGAEVHVFDRDGAVPADRHLHRLDISDRAAVAQVVAGLPRPPTLLVNNAGITRDRTIVKMSDEEWDAVIAVNLSAAFALIRAVAPGMVAAQSGRIVNISSINGLRGKFGQANYAAAKAGLIALTKTAAREFGPKGVTVNAVAPGMVLTEMTRRLPEDVLGRAFDESALKQLPEAGDIADAVLFLLSDRARRITGQILKVDSGQYL